MVARYAHDPLIPEDKRAEFIGDWIGVCDDEARHFTLIQNRLKDMDSYYGDQQAHNGLWEAAVSTMNDLAARLVIAPMVFEARGLDVTPTMIVKLENVGRPEKRRHSKNNIRGRNRPCGGGRKMVFLYLRSRKPRKRNLFQSIWFNCISKGKLKPHLMKMPVQWQA